MTDAVPPATLDLIGKILDGMLPAHCAVRSVEALDPTTSAAVLRMRLRRMAPGSFPIDIRCDGWGPGFERETVTMRTALDLSKPNEDAIGEAFGILGSEVFKQAAIAQAAKRAGIDRPLEGDGLLRTDHLAVDPDSMRAVADLLGSEAAAVRWMRDQMALRRAQTERPQAATEKQRLISVLGTIMKIELRLNPLAFSHRDGDPNADTLSHWVDNQAYVVGSIPETVMLSVPGRRVGEIVEGTPIGHRIIRHAISDGGDVAMPAFVAFEMATPRVPLDDVLGRAP